MNKKGQNVGSLIMVLVAVIVGAVLMVQVARDIGGATNTMSANQTITPVYATPVALVGQELFTTPIVTNSTLGSANVPVGNYDIAEGVIGGVKRIVLNSTNITYTGQEWRISYDYGAEGYIDNAGARSIATIILIFMGLAIAIIALVPALRSGVLEMMGR